jgi:type IV secretion system protein VirB9
MSANLAAAALIGALLFASTAYADGSLRRPQEDTARIGAEAGPLDALAAANETARQRPAPARFERARQIYAYEAGAIYELYANPQYVSIILLEPGESVANIAAGDTSRWMVTETQGDEEGRTLVLVKPEAANLRTNIVVVTDRRTYEIEAVSEAGAAYSAQMAWTYPRTEESSAEPSLPDLNFNYSIRTTKGASPIWTPSRVFDDGRRTWIQFAVEVDASDLPPLFVVTPDGRELVNYRVQTSASGKRYMLDRLFDVAELRLGAHAEIVVRIERIPESRARKEGPQNAARPQTPPGPRR